MDCGPSGFSSDAEDWAKKNGVYEELFGCQFKKLDRDNESLVQLVEDLGGVQAGDKYSEFVVVEIPEGSDWRIDRRHEREYIIKDGNPWK